MKFKDFLDLYDNWNDFITVNDENLTTIASGRIYDIMKTCKKLFKMKVISFGFYDKELYVRIK